jgi:hypothetical protein
MGRSLRLRLSGYPSSRLTEIGFLSFSRFDRAGGALIGCSTTGEPPARRRGPRSHDPTENFTAGQPHLAVAKFPDKLSVFHVGAGHSRGECRRLAADMYEKRN